MWSPISVDCSPDPFPLQSVTPSRDGECLQRDASRPVADGLLHRGGYAARAAQAGPAGSGDGRLSTRSTVVRAEKGRETMLTPSKPSPDERGQRWLQAQVQQILAAGALRLT